MINLRDIEREYSPDGGNLGRGKVFTKAELADLDTTGYTPYAHPGTGQTDFVLYGTDGSPSNLVWRGYVREENGVHYCAAVEYYNI